MSNKTTKTKTEFSIKDYPIIELDVNDIKKDKSNPNVMTLEQMNGLEKSLVNFGRLKHIVVDQDNILIDGEHRLEVEIAIGTSKVNVIQVQVKDEVERKIIRETLNKLHGEYDKQKESSELLAIFEDQRLDELAELLAKPKQELENLISRYNPEVKFEREEDESKLPSLFDTESFVKRGEVWQLGRHRLMCGDCTNKEKVSKLMNNKNIDMVLTDPPYNIDFDYNEFYDSKNNNEYANLIKGMFDNVKDISKRQIITCGPGNITLFENTLGKCYDIGIWQKDNSLSGSKLFNTRITEPILFYGNYDDCTKLSHDVFLAPAENGWLVDKILVKVEKEIGIQGEGKSNNNHAPAKPKKLIQDLIKNYSKENDMIVDPFLGFGSTIIACEQTNRICYGMEIDKHYCSVIIKRWENYTNQKANRLSAGMPN